ncbi:YeiH family protein [Pueribacillus sp. YX66]|uniref:YeiH family protein n=1 Tax=Pueribacillus sp. YX66 TaxID=3229242 RepID=UPI00358D8A06
MEVDIKNIQKREKRDPNRFRLWIGGVLFTFIIALFGYLLAKTPVFHLIGQMASAIFLAVVYRHFFNYPEALRAGITFSSKNLLRFAIMLYGLKLNVSIIIQDGLGLVVRDALIITFAILSTLWLAKILRAERKLSLLLGVGTGVCGAAAIAAVAPIVKAKDEDTALGVGIIALIGTVFAVVYTFFIPFLPFEISEYAIWAGMSLHEIAHVVLATAPGGEEALAIGLLAKLGRVLLLIPLCFVFIFFMKRKKPHVNEETEKIQFPYFLIGFIAFSLFGSYVLGPIIPVKESVMDGVSSLTSWLLTAAMVGLGLNINLRDLRTKAMKPILAISITSIFVSVIAYVLV